VFRVVVALLTSTLIGLAFASAVFAHNPTPRGANAPNWSQNATSTYGFSTAVPSWLRPNMQDVLQTQWTSNTTNNSRRVTFTLGTGPGLVDWADTTTVTACNMIQWLGCTSGGGSTSWHIWIRQTPSHQWCQLSNVSGCYDVVASRICWKSADGKAPRQG
jgi:hypothetical protein